MKNAIVWFAVVLFCAGAPIVGAQEQSLGEIARQLRQQKAKVAMAGPSTVPAPVDYESVVDAVKHTHMRGDVCLWDEDFSETAYTDAVRALLAKEDFEKLDTIADAARVSKIRVPGGTWLLYHFYSGITSPFGGKNAADAAWENHITILKRWVEQRPQSITARVALAQAYVNYGWKARGTGYADRPFFR